MRRRVSFAYVVQLDLPGFPVKIGHTSQPRARLKAFEIGTPVDCRVVGMTIDGGAREAAMLEATRDTAIKYEWRYPNDALRALIAEYFLAGEWFVEAPDAKAHFAQANVAQRVRPYVPDSYSVTLASANYHYAQTALQAAAESDPLLGLDWSGFIRATAAPSLDWPAQRQAA